MATLEQEGYQWRDDTQDETSDGNDLLAAQDANITRWRNVNTRLRVLVNATGDPDATQFRLEYRKKGSANWYVVNTGELSDLPSPSASLSPSISPSESPSASPSLSPSASLSPSKSPSISPSLSPSKSPSVSPSLSPSESPSASPSAGGPVQIGYDLFDRGDSTNLGTDWTEVGGNVQIVSSAVRMVAGDVWSHTKHNTITSSSNQYIKFTHIFDTSFEVHSIIEPHFRKGTNYYYISIDALDQTVSWFDQDDHAIDSDSISYVSGNTLGFTLTGTESNTIIRIWVNPTGNVPDSATSWGGDATPDVTLTNPGTYVVDTGTSAGFGLYLGAAGSEAKTQIDNFYFGDL